MLSLATVLKSISLTPATPKIKLAQPSELVLFQKLAALANIHDICDGSSRSFRLGQARTEDALELTWFARKLQKRGQIDVLILEHEKHGLNFKEVIFPWSISPKFLLTGILRAEASKLGISSQNVNETPELVSLWTIDVGTKTVYSTRSGLRHDEVVAAVSGSIRRFNAPKVTPRQHAQPVITTMFFGQPGVGKANDGKPGRRALTRGRSAPRDDSRRPRDRKLGKSGDGKKKNKK